MNKEELEKIIEDKNKTIESLNERIEYIEKPGNVVIEQFHYDSLQRDNGLLYEAQRKIEDLEKLNSELYRANCKMCESIAGLTNDGVLKDMSATIVKLTVDKYR